MLVVLFLMGMHSAFFGPAKYGILPEMIRADDLPRGERPVSDADVSGDHLRHGAGRLFADVFWRTTLWVGSLVCMGIAVVGTCDSASWSGPFLPRSRTLKHCDGPAWFVPPEILRLAATRPAAAVRRLSSSPYSGWSAASCAQTVNALGKTQLGVDDGPTSVLTASIGVGIADRLHAGRLFVARPHQSKSRQRRRVGTVIATLVLMALPGGHASAPARLSTAAFRC